MIPNILQFLKTFTKVGWIVTEVNRYTTSIFKLIGTLQWLNKRKLYETDVKRILLCVSLNYSSCMYYLIGFRGPSKILVKNSTYWYPWVREGDGVPLQEKLSKIYDIAYWHSLLTSITAIIWLPENNIVRTKLFCS